MAESNFHDHLLLRTDAAPTVDFHIANSSTNPGGIAEPGTTLAMPRVANAIAAVTGMRLQHLRADGAALVKTQLTSPAERG